MGRSSNDALPETPVQEARFVAAYLSTGDAHQAYVQAGYDGDSKVGPLMLLKRPSVIAALKRAAAAIEETSLGVVRTQVANDLQTREGLTNWLVQVISGEVTESYTDREGNTFDTPAKLKDRIKAAELLSKISGFLAPQEVNVRGVQVVLHTVDNGRLIRE